MIERDCRLSLYPQGSEGTVSIPCQEELDTRYPSARILMPQEKVCPVPGHGHPGQATMHWGVEAPAGVGEVGLHLA